MDLGCGGALGPLFDDGSFEFCPIPGRTGHTYSETPARRGGTLAEYLPLRLAHAKVHRSPDFGSGIFLYGDPTRLKSGLARLVRGDLLVFYAGLTRWNAPVQSNLYLVGYFEVVAAGLACDFTLRQRWEMLKGAWCCWIGEIIAPTMIVLVKGGPGSRLLDRAVKISAEGEDSAGRRLLVMSSEAQKRFGDFGGARAIQRCPPRWVDEDHTATAAEYVRSLR